MTTLTLPRSLTSTRLSRPSALTLIAVAAFALRLLLIGQSALWYDETGSVWMASLPFDRMVAATAGDTHPPLYFALLWVWVRLFGTGEIAVRIPSLILSMLTLWLTYKLGQRLNLPRPAILLAVGLLAFNPAQIYFAQEARMYALFTVEVLIALIAALDKRWWLMGLALAAGYWTQNYGLVFAVPINALALFAIFVRARSPRPNAYVAIGKVADGCRQASADSTMGAPLQELAYWLFFNALALASWFPWLTTLAGQMKDVSNGYWIPPITAGSALDAIFKTVWGLILTDTTQAHAALLLFGAMTFALIRSILKRDRATLLCWLLVLIPVAAAVVASAAWKPILLFRALMPIVPPLMLAIGWAFTHGLNNRARLAAALFAVPVIAATLIGYYQHVATQKGNPNDWLSAMDWRDGDIIYHLNEGSYMTLHFYTDRPQYMLPRGDWKNLGALSDRTKEAMGFQFADLDTLKWRVAWFIVATGPTTHPGEEVAIQNILEKYPHRVVKLDEYPLSTFALYQLYNPWWPAR